MMMMCSLRLLLVNLFGLIALAEPLLNPFVDKSCMPCKTGAPPMSLADARANLALMGPEPQWTLRATARHVVPPGPQLGSGFALNVTSIAALDSKAALADESHWILSLHKKMTFDDFKLAVTFFIRAAAMCEKEGHHADIQVGFKYAEVSLYTHKIKGLHENDFIMAAKIDELTVEGTTTSPGATQTLAKKSLNFRPKTPKTDKRDL